MNVNELTPMERFVLLEIADGFDTGHPQYVLDSLKRLCLIEKNPSGWNVTKTTVGLVREIWEQARVRA